MKNSLCFVVSCLALFLMVACNYAKPVMYVDIVNNSGHAIQNLEVQHPTDRGPGQFGLPALRSEQRHQHMIPIGTPCHFRVQFDDESGKHYAQEFDLGQQCPTQVVFELDAGMKVSERTGTR